MQEPQRQSPLICLETRYAYLKSNDKTTLPLKNKLRPEKKGLALGCAFAFWYLATFILLIRKERFEFQLCGLNLLFWFVCCGIKGPVAIVVIFIPFFYC